MRIKAKDVAKALGISTATVSLALNNKSGVGEKRKKEILEYIDAMKNMDASVVEAGRNIMIIIARKDKNIVCDSELNLWSEILRSLDTLTKQAGYGMTVTYYDVFLDDISQLLEQCRKENIAGIMLFATELDEEDFTPFTTIDKPVVIYDNDFENLNYHTFVINNKAGVKHAINYLVSRGHTKILYAAISEKIYNFDQRRIGFKEGMLKNNLEYSLNQMLVLDNSIDGITDSMLRYLKQCKELPDAIVMENYQVSIGVIRALLTMKIKIKEDISIIGIDELPNYTLLDFELTTVKIIHTPRAQMAIRCLIDQIETGEKEKTAVFVATEFIKGNSVK